jgi:hypothetical protein
MGNETKMITDILRGGKIGVEKPHKTCYPTIKLKRQFACDDCGHNTWTFVPEPLCKCLCHTPAKEDEIK